MSAEDTVTPIVTGNYRASLDEFVRFSGNGTVGCPSNADVGAKFTVKQAGVGTVTVVGHVDGTSNGLQIATQHGAVTLICLGSERWATYSSAGGGVVDGGTP